MKIYCAVADFERVGDFFGGYSGKERRMKAIYRNKGACYVGLITFMYLIPIQTLLRHQDHLLYRCL